MKGNTMITQAEFIQKEIIKAATDKAASLPQERPTGTGVECDCGKELHWQTDLLYGIGPYFGGVKCECGRHGYWDWWNKKFVWLDEHSK